MQRALGQAANGTDEQDGQTRCSTARNFVAQRNLAGSMDSARGVARSTRVASAPHLPREIAHACEESHSQHTGRCTKASLADIQRLLPGLTPWCNRLFSILLLLNIHSGNKCKCYVPKFLRSSLAICLARSFVTARFSPKKRTFP